MTILWDTMDIGAQIVGTLYFIFLEASMAPLWPSGLLMNDLSDGITAHRILNFDDSGLIGNVLDIDKYQMVLSEIPLFFVQKVAKSCSYDLATIFFQNFEF